jgi:hypothetical protein
MIASITSFVGKVVSTVRDPIFGTRKPKSKVAKTGKSAKAKRCGRKCRCG